MHNIFKEISDEFIKMSKQQEIIKYDQEDLKKNQIECLEVKNVVVGIKTLTDCLDSTLNIASERIRELEYSLKNT